MPVSRVAMYAEVNATVRALYAQLLTPEAIQSLVYAPELNVVLNQLSRTAYAPHLNLPRHLLTPRRTVYQLRWRLADVYEKIIKRTSPPGRDLIKHMWQLYEVDNLKATLRGVEKGASWDQVLHLLSPMRRDTTLTVSDFQRMLLAGDIVHAIERIRGTPYHGVLAYALPRVESERTLFPLEIALDLDYRRRMWARIQELSGEDRTQALRLLGPLLDLDNLLWAIRFRVYHRLSPEEIINYTLPLGYQLTDADIRAIAEGANIADTIRRVYPSVPALADLQTEVDGVPVPPGNWLGRVEAILTSRFRDRCMKTIHMADPFHIGTPLAYLMLAEHEIRILTAVIEAKASGANLTDMLAAYVFGAANVDARTIPITQSG